MSSFFTAAAKQRAALDFVGTDEQEAGFAYVEKMERGQTLSMNSCAGSGKTTFEIHALYRTGRAGERGETLFLTFANKNAAELRRRAPSSVRCMTFHAFSLDTFKSGQPDVGKLWRIAKAKVDDFGLRAPAWALAGLAKGLALGLEGSLPDDLDTFEGLVTEYGIRHKKRFSPRQVAREARKVFHLSLNEKDTKDFDDLLYTFARDGVQDRLAPLDWLLIDEGQDLSPVQMLMMDRLTELGDGGCRKIIAGDPRQAIYGWRGAGVYSMQIMERAYKAHILKMTRTQRCARLIAEYAAQIVPDIRARDGAPDGSVRHMLTADFHISEVPSGDAVVCRNNAPLLGLALQAIRAGKPVYIAGKDLPEKILKTLDGLFEKGKYHPRNGQKAFEDAEREINREFADRPFVRSLLRDDMRAARAVWEICQAKASDAEFSDYENLRKYAVDMMAKLFFDPEKVAAPPGVVLTTIHRAKGLEWQQVWYYRPELVPSLGAQELGGWHLEQESNLEYVARTRAISSLVLVHGKPEED